MPTDEPQRGQPLRAANSAWPSPRPRPRAGHAQARPNETAPPNPPQSLGGPSLSVCRPATARAAVPQARQSSPSAKVARFARSSSSCGPALHPPPRRSGPHPSGLRWRAGPRATWACWPGQLRAPGPLRGLALRARLGLPRTQAAPSLGAPLLGHSSFLCVGARLRLRGGHAAQPGAAVTRLLALFCARAGSCGAAKVRSPRFPAPPSATPAPTPCKQPLNAQTTPRLDRR
jgi:hypothetical protein